MCARMTAGHFIVLDDERTRTLKRLWISHNEYKPKSHAHQSVRLHYAANANVSHDVVRILSVLLRLVRYRADAEDHPRRPRDHHRSNRDHEHGRRRQYRADAARHRLAVRSHRASIGLHLVASAGVAAGDAGWAVAELRDLLDHADGDRCRRGLVRDHAVSHVGDVRSELCRDRECHHGGLGQPRRRRHADRDAIGVCGRPERCGV